MERSAFKNLKPVFTAVSKYYAGQKHVPQCVIDLYQSVIDKGVFGSSADSERLNSVSK